MLSETRGTEARQLLRFKLMLKMSSLLHIRADLGLALHAQEDRKNAIICTNSHLPHVLVAQLVLTSLNHGHKRHDNADLFFKVLEPKCHG